MFKEVIYQVIENCEHCKQDITTRLRSDDPDFLKKAPGLKKEVAAQGMNQHWYAVHHICAKCGELIKKGQTTYALKSKISWPINETYLEVNSEKHAYGALNVHKACVLPEDQ